MKSNYLIAPLIGFVSFAAYYVYWQRHPPAPTEAVQPADPYALRDGKRDAEAELAAGRLVLIETGPQLSWDPERREIARETYGVELRRMDAARTEAAARYMDAFNRVMRPQILGRHGRGFFDTLHREAIARHEAAARK